MKYCGIALQKRDSSLVSFTDKDEVACVRNNFLKKKLGRPADILWIEPRGLNRVKAAAYIDVSPTTFDEMVKDGRMPLPKIIGRRKVWDRRKIDLAFEALPDDGRPDANPWDEVA